MDPSNITLQIDYPPRFEPRYGHGKPPARHILALFEQREEEMLGFVSTMREYLPQFSRIPVDADAHSQQPYWNQAWFPPLDGMSMYAILASNRPATFLEIGSGNSTKFAACAVFDQALDTRIISVDPEPRSEIDAICDRIIRKPLEQADELEELIPSLAQGDVVFFDGSHRCLQNSDVTSFFIDHLPAIPDGVVVGIHDIFWPNDYGADWVGRYYNEQYVVGTYMLAQGARFPLIFSCQYMGLNHPRLVSECLDPALLATIQQSNRRILGGSLWFRKISL